MAGLEFELRIQKHSNFNSALLPPLHAPCAGLHLTIHPHPTRVARDSWGEKLKALHCSSSRAELWVQRFAPGQCLKQQAAQPVTITDRTQVSEARKTQSKGGVGAGEGRGGQETPW